MHKFEKFLTFYSTTVIAILLVASVTFLQRPHNFLMLGLFLPICIYFWLRVTSPEGTSVSKWSLRLLVVLFVFTGLGLTAYFLSTNNFLSSEKVQENAELKEEISSLKNDLKDIKNSLNITPTSTESAKLSADDETIADVLGDNDKPLERNILGYVAKMPSNGIVYIYKGSSTDSEIVSEMKEGVNYPFYDKVSSYYLIGLGDDEAGYVKVNLVKQVIVSP